MNIATITAFSIYLILMLIIGVIGYYKTNSLSDYILGGRNLNSWVAAFSAQASDMSGWLLLGLPGLLSYRIKCHVDCDRFSHRNISK